MIFYLGTTEPTWLRQTSVPLCISRQRLDRRYVPVRAKCPWVLDSGGFTELSFAGRWRVSPCDYAKQTRLWMQESGNLQWAATQDWMCEEVILKKTGLSIRKHQELTTYNYLTLKALAPDVPWMPVLQGWDYVEYFCHLTHYQKHGIWLRDEPIVGVGSICTREGTTEAEKIIRDLAKEGLQLHAFGFKTQGLQNCADVLSSADSMAWSFAARARKIRLDGCKHLNCNNCLTWALQWREKLLEGGK